jgi:hypothetical protein
MLNKPGLSVNSPLSIESKAGPELRKSAGIDCDGAPENGF